MKNHPSFADVLKQWPSMAAFGEDLGIDANHAQTMKNRDSIPSRFWLEVEEAAKRRGINGISIKILASIEAAKTRPAKVKKGLSRKAGVNHPPRTRQGLNGSGEVKIV